MLGLMYKDFLLNRKIILTVMLSSAGFSLLMLMPAFIAPEGITDAEVLNMVISSFSMISLAMMFFVAGISAVNVFQTDEIKKYASFIVSTPVSVKGQIGAKYLLVLAEYMIMYSWCYLIQLIIITAVGSEAAAASPNMFLCAMLTVNAIEFPFQVRFGSKTGGMVKALISVIVLIAAFEYLLFGSFNIFDEASEDMFVKFIEFMQSKQGTDSAAVLTAASPFAACGLYFLSYKLSCKLYLKGAETYAK